MSYIVDFYNISSGYKHSSHSSDASSPEEAERQAREELNNLYGRNLQKPQEAPQDYAQYFRAVVLDSGGQPTDVRQPEPVSAPSQQNGGAFPWSNGSL